jgi:phosphoenolpyruvate phosphomutase
MPPRESSRAPPRDDSHASARPRQSTGSAAALCVVPETWARRVHWSQTAHVDRGQCVEYDAASRTREFVTTAVSPFDSRERLRRLLEGHRLGTLGGAHDALSARLVEEAGFDGVWASSFGISLATRCLPDVDLLTMSETLATVRNIRLAVQVPVVADCNAGWGNAINVIRLVHDFENAGVDGICVEDNRFPKRCSLYEDCVRQIVSAGEMAGKIRAAKRAQSHPAFVVIARCESLIANEGVSAALERADAYADAGADALLVHARAFEPLEEFVGSWCGGLPLVVVPTLFGHVPAEQLHRAGFRIAIYPNQAVRAAVTAMRDALVRLRESGRPQELDGRIATLGEIEELVRLDEVRAAEHDYIVAPAGFPD